jgi:hypothetical protein
VLFSVHLAKVGCGMILWSRHIGFRMEKCPKKMFHSTKPFQNYYFPTVYNAFLHTFLFYNNFLMRKFALMGEISQFLSAVCRKW